MGATLEKIKQETKTDKKSEKQSGSHRRMKRIKYAQRAQLIDDVDP